MTNFKFTFYGESVFSSSFPFNNKALMIAWTSRKNDINVSIPRLIKMCKEHKTSFEHGFAEAVSHEIIHNVLNKYVGESASIDFDNICIDKQDRILKKRDLKKFRGGIPWWED